MKETRPFDALVEAKGKKVNVYLKNGQKYEGELKSFDIHLNLILENTNEEKEGELGRILIRGDSIDTIRGL